MLYENLSMKLFYYLDIEIQIQQTLTSWKLSEFRFAFCSAFSHIRTKYGGLQIQSPYSLEIWKSTDQKK